MKELSAFEPINLLKCCGIGSRMTQFGLPRVKLQGLPFMAERPRWLYRTWSLHQSRYPVTAAVLSTRSKEGRRILQASVLQNNAAVYKLCNAAWDFKFPPRIMWKNCLPAIDGVNSDQRFGEIHCILRQGNVRPAHYQVYDVLTVNPVKHLQNTGNSAYNVKKTMSADAALHWCSDGVVLDIDHSL
jgi:hypothetical protein